MGSSPSSSMGSSPKPDNIQGNWAQFSPVEHSPLQSFTHSASFQHSHSFPDSTLSGSPGTMPSFGPTTSNASVIGTSLPFERHFGYYPESPETSFMNQAFHGKKWEKFNEKVASLAYAVQFSSTQRAWRSLVARMGR